MFCALGLLVPQENDLLQIDERSVTATTSESEGDLRGAKADASINIFIGYRTVMVYGY
jgi:hypothetical protein